MGWFGTRCSSWLVAAFLAPPGLLAADRDAKALNQNAVSNGLQWLASQQKPTGEWSENGAYPTTMTALAGMACLMEGSNIREGKYSDNIAKAVEYLVARQHANGMIGNPANPTETSRYMYGHGYSMMFLASAYGDEDSAIRRRVLAGVLARAVKFSEQAQTAKGGWGYVSGKDGGGFDQGYTVVMQLQGLRACQNAGIAVPKAVIEKAMRYYENSTTERGGLVYSSMPTGVQPAVGAERPPVTATALASAASLNRLRGEYPLRWARFCRDTIYVRPRQFGHDEFQGYYFAQAMYAMGDDGYGKMHPNEDPKTWMTWTAYKKDAFDHLRSSQNASGAWNGGYAGSMFATTTALAILQLENGVLPIYSR